MRAVLLLGAGSCRKLQVDTPAARTIPTITTLDIEPSHNPGVVWDLNVLPWPFGDNTYDEVHAYETLEHFGRQGDAAAFFAHFGEIYRVLKPGGYLAGSVPRWDSKWAWGDPSHTRVINEGSLVFLDRTKYSRVGETTMTDFRPIWKGDFSAEGLEKTEGRLFFLLKAHKPVRA